jgi:hypothetical protein
VSATVDVIVDRQRRHRHGEGDPCAGGAQLANNRVWWIDVERWLVAHRINEIAVLCAQPLGERMIDELKAHVCRRLGIAVALIYGRPTRAVAVAVTDLGDYLARKRDPPPRVELPEPWPKVPRSPALGLLLHGRNARIPCRDRPVRSRFETLRARGILERRYRVYRASHIALYSIGAGA